MLYIWPGLSARSPEVCWTESLSLFGKHISPELIYNPSTANFSTTGVNRSKNQPLAFSCTHFTHTCMRAARAAGSEVTPVRHVHPVHPGGQQIEFRRCSGSSRCFRISRIWNHLWMCGAAEGLDMQQCSRTRQCGNAMRLIFILWHIYLYFYVYLPEISAKKCHAIIMVIWTRYQVNTMFFLLLLIMFFWGACTLKWYRLERLHRIARYKLAILCKEIWEEMWDVNTQLQKS